MKSQTLLLLAITTCGLLCSSGCRWKGWPGFVSPWQQQQDAGPVLFTSIPPKEELVAALNSSTARVNSLQSQGASVSLSGFRAQTELAFERPNKLRFRANSSLLGPVVDMGSNEEMLWFWTSQSNPPNVFFARHDRLATSNIRQQLAIDPNMFIEALGFVQLSPENVVGEPVSADKNRLKFVYRQPTPAGDLNRTLYVHARHGYLMEQQIADSAGRPMLSAKLSQQRYYSLDSVTLPHHVELQMPGEGMKVNLDVPQYLVNQAFNEGNATFVFPREQLGQYQMVDIADPNFVPPGQAPPAQYSSPGYPQPDAPQVPTAQRYRGSPEQR
ncbi:hypothetical protein NA78x_004152 [Anatilimnocola sp. NA78]|uniref:hypothetical protein n=1 Tax=Anatilimnocola sp. NA78 TaxID=3415683 RepID=UPI003CE59B61